MPPAGKVELAASQEAIQLHTYVNSDETETQALDPLDYAATDVPVFPLSGKNPIEKAEATNCDGVYIPKGMGGFHQATTDPDKIERWKLAHPGCNWGTPTGHHIDAVTGQPNAHPFDVLDVDPKHGGTESLARLIAENGPLPPTAHQVTGSGGHHYAFASDGILRNSAGSIAPGIDVRGTGGYIVLDPSIHPDTGEPYTWAVPLINADGSFNLAPKPSWLVSRKRAHEPHTTIPEGQRNAALTSEAGAMRRRGASKEAIMAYLNVRNLEACTPPLPDDELEKIAESVAQYESVAFLIDAPLSDAGNGERFAFVNTDRAMYCAALKTWYCWDGKRWSADDIHTIDEWAVETMRATGRVAHEWNPNDALDRERRESVIIWALRSESDRRLTDMVKRARGKLAVRAKDLNADPWLLNVANGTVDLRTGELLPHVPAHRMTKLAPVTYDPDATLPEWEAFLAETTAGKEGLADFLQLAMGYSLTGLTSEEKLFLVHGPAGSGKSTLVEAIKATLGDYAATADFEAFIKHQSSGGPRNDIARLTGARYVSSIEVEQGKQLAEALVKAISGGDTVAARFLYAESQEFKPSLKLWLVANDAPSFNADDTGMHRRLLRLPLDNVVPDERKDPRVKALLTDPAQAGPAILAWAVRGCLRWQELGKLPVPEVVKADTARYLAEQDGLSNFLAEACVLGPEQSCASRALFDAYEGYWLTYGKHNRERRMTQQGFSKALARREGIEPGRPTIEGKQVRGWLGIDIKPQTMDDDDD